MVIYCLFTLNCLFSTNTAQVLADAGVLPGGDMTPEAALTKLSYVLAKPGLTHQERLKVGV